MRALTPNPNASAGQATPDCVAAGSGAGSPEPAPAHHEFAEADRRFMLELARRALASATTNSEGPNIDSTCVPACLNEPRACFVTLTKNGALRGCVGNLLPHAPLYQAIIENARRAALRDPRFPPVAAGEVGELKIEISLLDEAQPLEFNSPEELLSLLRPHVDGVLLQIGTRLAMFLPQVWRQIPDKAQFLDHLAEKAGYPATAWRNKDALVSVYSVESFGEN